MAHNQQQQQQQKPRTCKVTLATQWFHPVQIGNQTRNATRRAGGLVAANQGGKHTHCD